MVVVVIHQWFLVFVFNKNEGDDNVKVKEMKGND